MRIRKPEYNHNGGDLHFHPGNHLLYIGTGDGGGGNDPLQSGQALGTVAARIVTAGAMLTFTLQTHSWARSCAFRWTHPLRKASSTAFPKTIRFAPLPELSQR